MGKATKASVQEKLFEALAKIDRPGAFCTSGIAPAIVPGLEIDGIGPIALPLTGAQANDLKQRCEQAPYGKGKDTLVDTKVRRVWRLAPGKFSLTNPAWTTLLDETVAKVQEELGLVDQPLRPHLYELLLYEKGSFFLPHRDGEKLDRMVATLVVMLPSAYEGGELIVRHEGEQQVIDFAGHDTRFEVHYAAFYADCEHEVKPLRRGYRLCLVYNLTLEKSKRSLGAPRSLEHIGAIAGVLREWSNSGSDPQKLAITLEHQYTQKGLEWDALKGVDRAKARGLAAAAEQVGYQAHLALLTLWESGSATSSEDYYGGWGRRRFRHQGKVEYAMEEIFDTSLTAEHWRGPAGDRPVFGAIPVQRAEIVPEQSLTAVKPEEDFQGYTGNEGMTLERWYRHAAILLWPEARHFDVLCEGGSLQAVPALARMVRAWRKSTGPKAVAQKERCLQFARKILDHWPENPYHEWRPASERSDASDPMRCLGRLDEPSLIRTYLSKVFVKDAKLEPSMRIATAILKHGWATFRPELVELFTATGSETIERNVQLLDRLCLANFRRTTNKSEAKEALETCRQLAEAAVYALDQVDAKPAANDWRISRIDRVAMLARLVRALLTAGLDDLLSQVVFHAQNFPNRYPLIQIQMPALAKLSPWAQKNLKRRSPALMKWIAECQRELERLTAKVPQPPTDLRREAPVNCKCGDCKELNRFLADPKEREHSFQMPQDRRSHLESNIRAAKCDLDCTTNKRPRPQILICTKNMASHKRRLKAYHKNLEHLAALESLEESLPK